MRISAYLLIVVSLIACSPVSSVSNDSGGSGDIDGDTALIDATTDPCALCSEFAECVEPASGKECRCLSGYTGDGIICEDIDECAVANGGCAAAATCTNMDGDYSCTCPSSTVGDGTVCHGNSIFFANNRDNGAPTFFKSYDTSDGTLTDHPFPTTTNDFCRCGLSSSTIYSARGSLYNFANEGQRFQTDWQPVSYPGFAQRGEYGAAVLGDKIYFVGGRDPQANKLSCFDTETETWSGIGALADYPVAVDYPAVAAIGGRLYVAGGFTTPSAAFASRYNPNADSWSALPVPPFNNNSAYGASDGTLFYVFSYPFLYALNPANLSLGWKQVSALPSAFMRPAVAGGELYAVGDGDTDNIEIYKLVVNGALSSFVLQLSIPDIIMGDLPHVGGTD